MFMISWKKVICDRVMRSPCFAIIVPEKIAVKAPASIAVYERKTPDGSGKVIGSFYCPLIYEWTIDSKTNVALSQLTGVYEDVLETAFHEGQVINLWFVMNKKLYSEPRDLTEFERNGEPVTRPPIRYMEVSDFNA